MVPAEGGGVAVPVYEYVCQDCGSRFDALRPMRDADAPIACHECESEHTSRALSVFFAQSDGRTVAGRDGGCASCAGGSCATCRN
jgi:putative FmdB family regulatory protein